jgi:hypothetical protein
MKKILAGIAAAAIIALAHHAAPASADERSDAIRGVALVAWLKQSCPEGTVSDQTLMAVGAVRAFQGFTDAELLTAYITVDRELDAGIVGRDVTCRLIGGFMNEAISDGLRKIQESQ